MSVRADLSILVPHQTELDLQTGLRQVEVTGIEGSLAVLDQLGAYARNFKAMPPRNVFGKYRDLPVCAGTRAGRHLHLGDLIIEVVARRNVLEKQFGRSHYFFCLRVICIRGRSVWGNSPFSSPLREQSRERIQGIVGKKENGSIFVDLSLELGTKNPTNGRD